MRGRRLRRRRRRLRPRRTRTGTRTRTKMRRRMTRRRKRRIRMRTRRTRTYHSEDKAMWEPVLSLCGTGNDASSCHSRRHSLAFHTGHRDYPLQR